MPLTPEDLAQIGTLLDEKLEPIIADVAALKTAVNRGFAIHADDLALLEPPPRMKHPSTTTSAAALVSLHAAAHEQQHQWDVDRYQSQHSFVWEYGELR